MRAISHEKPSLTSTEHVGFPKPASVNGPCTNVLLTKADVFFRIRNGIITESSVTSKATNAALVSGENLSGLSDGVKLHEIKDWEALFPDLNVEWLNSVLPPLNYDRSQPETFHSVASRSV